MKITTTWAVIAVLLASQPVSLAFADSPIRQQTLENESQDLNLPLSQIGLAAETQATQAQRERAEQPSGAIEGGFSSWEPSNLQPVSRIQNPSAFSMSALPGADLNVLHPLNPTLSLKIGGSFLALQRTGTLDAAGQTSQQVQDAYIPSLRLGVEVSSPKFASKLFRPYASGALLPSMLITNRSAFDDGESDFGVPVEFGAGVLVRVMQSFNLDLGVTEVVGKVGPSDFTGFGVGAGVRVQL